MTTPTLLTQQRRIYGEGWSWPLRAAPTGQLARTAGEQRIDESLRLILETPLGSRPLDPSYGVPLEVYDPVTDVVALAWALAQALERCEPRVQDLTLEILGVRPSDATVAFRLTYRARGQLTPTTRTFPFYRLAT